MRPCDRRNDRSALGMTSRLDGRAGATHHAPAARRSLEPEVCDRDTRRPVLWLDEARGPDDRVGKLLVRVPEDDEVDACNFSSDASRDVLARHSGRRGVVARRPAEAGVHRHDDDVGALRAGLGHGRANFRNDVAHDDPTAEVVPIPQHRAWRRGADNTDAHATPLDDDEGRVGATSIGVVDVRREKRERGLFDGPDEGRQPVIELVIAYRRRVVVHDVHRGDDRVGAGRVDATGDEREWVALQQVPCVDQHDAIGIRRAYGVDDRGGPREAAHRVDCARVVIPAGEPAVDVSGRRDHEIERRGSSVTLSRL